jgi:hypothetical protein
MVPGTIASWNHFSSNRLSRFSPAKRTAMLMQFFGMMSPEAKLTPTQGTAFAQIQ